MTKQKRITKEEQDELAEVLYYISEEDEREISKEFSSRQEPEWDFKSWNANE